MSIDRQNPDFFSADFKNQRVIIDDTYHLNCRFTNCVFQYSGGGVLMVNNTIRGTVSFDLREGALRTYNFLNAIMGRKAEGGLPLLLSMFEYDPEEVLA